MYSLTINCPSLDALIALAARLTGDKTTGVVSTPNFGELSAGGAHTVLTAETPAKPAKAKPAKAEKAAPAEEPQDRAPLPAAVVESEVSYEQVSKATLALVTAKGRTAAVDLLATFGATKALELKPEQYADYLRTANDLLGESELA